MAFNYKDWRELLLVALHGIVLQYTLQQGQPPNHPSVYNIKAVPHNGRSEPRQRKFQWKLSWIEFKSVTAVCRGQLYQKVEQVSTKKTRPHECQESGLVLKVILSDLTDFKGKECLITKDGAELVRLVNTDAVKKYFVKMKSSISHKLEKAV